MWTRRPRVEEDSLRYLVVYIPWCCVAGGRPRGFLCVARAISLRELSAFEATNAESLVRNENVFGPN